jgi:FtsZ-binding cell division protein ZapB
MSVTLSDEEDARLAATIRKDGEIISLLRARIAELEAENAELKRERDEAKEAARAIFEAAGPQ